MGSLNWFAKERSTRTNAKTIFSTTLALFPSKWPFKSGSRPTRELPFDGLTRIVQKVGKKSSIAHQGSRAQSKLFHTLKILNISSQLLA